MDRTNHQDIRIGAMASMSAGPEYIAKIIDHGFESFEPNCWQHIGPIDLEDYAKRVLDICGDRAVINAIGIYGNPLQDEQTREDWARMIRAAKFFGAKAVCGFAGALEDRSVDGNMERFKEVWEPLAKLAEDEGVKIGFENCDMGGTWERPKYNIAHSPRAWEMMFDAVPSEALGLEWEPCHQMVSLADPIRQLRKWARKVVHLHGKDATVNWDLIEDYGIRSGLPIVYHRTPGFGDTNWSDVISILRLAGFRGSIDIEGWHDPVYREELEMTGQVHALEYLKSCRGGDYVPNP
ncbi:MAG: sugar phosphate isomerase/epimerase [Fimbriimonadales bacterium]|nr:sugar phosphate isomerase/epimerase [Fimbriimonadales bacterium]